MAESPLRVLIVDDNKDGADTVCMLLSLSGFRCETASDVPTGVEAAMRFNPDVVLFDLKMPGDGFRLPGLIRELPGRPPVFVAFTGLADAETTERLRSIGVIRHLAKAGPPTELLDLLATIDRGRGRKEDGSHPQSRNGHGGRGGE
jgi:CheY-like chemotaxis protein